MRIPVSILALLTLLSTGCKRDGGSYNFDDASEEAQQAIAANVEFVLDESTFQKWERAQANLEKLPAGELDKTPDPGGADPVARGIQRLESSPQARRAIESSGLSVKNFVLATVALAQAVKASRGGVPPTVGAIASNVRFVLAHASRVANRGAASVWVPPSELSEEEIAAMEATRADTIDHSDRSDRETNTETQSGQVITTPPEPPPVPRDTSGSSAPPTSDSVTARRP